MSIQTTLRDIVAMNRGLAEFWSNSEGWAPLSAAQLLSNARLDWQTSLSEALAMWCVPVRSALSDGELILAWANLRSLVEGTLKLFLSVHHQDYLFDTSAVQKRGKVVQPDEIQLEALRTFFVSAKLLPRHHQFIQLVQQRGNAIHSFKNRELGNASEFTSAVVSYLSLVKDVDSSLPYPDGVVFHWQL
jgi:hypothetical protein